MQKEEFKELLTKYLQGSTTEEEIERLWAGLESNEDKIHWEEAIEDILQNPYYHGLSDPRAMKEVFRRIMSKQGGEIVPMRRSPGKSIAVAAAILLLLGAAGYILHQYNKAHPKTAAKALAQVIIPGSNRATLVLSNGATINLDSATNGTLALQGNARIVKSTDGQLTCQKTAQDQKPPQESYNTLTTPRGGQYQLTLSDGTRVWLNAGSSIRYPTSFMGGEREVEITGEVYLEVAANEHMPFKVRTRGMEITVLGTDFDVNAYEDEDNIKTTLLSGKVKLTNNKAGRLLEPGEQGQLDPQGDFRVVQGIDTADIVAWKNGRIELGGNTIEPIMREVSRWYDVDIEYRGDKPTDNFMGGISRQGNVSELLKILEHTQAVHFIIEGRKIIVMKNTKG